MEDNKTYKLIVLLLFIVPAILVVVKIAASDFSFAMILPQEGYEVNYEISLQGNDKGLKVETYIPLSNKRQTITEESHTTGSLQYEAFRKKSGRKAKWTAKNVSEQEFLRYSFKYLGKAQQYELPARLQKPGRYPKSFNTYLRSTSNIQKDSTEIILLSDHLSKGTDDLNGRIRNFFDFVYSMPSQPFKGVTDAVTALRLNEASCNGKSRLLVALCRNQGIPARLVGGIILTAGSKSTSHQWVEIFLGNQWVPFDALNNHFAYIPSNYMELYRGDHYLFSHTSNINFEYQFNIKKKVLSNAGIGSELKQGFGNAYSIWALFERTGVSLGLLKIILLLPLGGLIVAIIRNVIGIKTFGVFLPVLIAVSFSATGYWFGLLSFVSVIIIVGLLQVPLEKWGILYIPKLAIMLLGVVMSFLALAYIGIKMHLSELAAVTLFPIVILTVTSERFARLVNEDSFGEALKVLLQTLLVTSILFTIIGSVSLQAIFLFFPELFAVILGILLLVGKWIGMRLTEYKRFHWIAS